MKSVQSEGVAGEVPMDTSASGEGFDATPMVLPVRGHLDAVKRLLMGDLYIGRGSRQRSLGKSRYCNNYKVSEFGRDAAITKFRDAPPGRVDVPISLDALRQAPYLPLPSHREVPWRRAH